MSCGQTIPLAHTEEADTDGSDEFFSPSSSPEPRSPPADSPDDAPVSYQVLLSPKCLPHAVHILPLNQDIHLVVMIESGSPMLSSGLHEAFLYLTTLQTIQVRFCCILTLPLHVDSTFIISWQVQRDLDTIRPAFENLDIAIKKTSDGIKKLGRQAIIETCHKRLISKWDFMKKKYQEYFKSRDSECILRAESSAGGLLACLRELLAVTCFDSSMLHASSGRIYDVGATVNARLAMFSEFLKAKAMKNLSLGSYPFYIQ